jgi:hypothetical protein
MKIKLISRIICVILVTILLVINSFAQLQLGPQRLVSLPAPTLRNRTPLRVGIPRTGRPRIAFVGRVGGVAFDSVAKPADGVTVNSLKLSYSPTKPDGERLSMTVNGQAVSVPIYDWQLVPIAKFANSPFYSCFTLFGELKNSEEQAAAVNRGARILNYHPEFANTLLGLRLFQLDNLIINKHSYDLPKDPTGYVLGAGESPPNIEANQQGWKAFESYSEDNIELFKNGQAYVISDRDREVTFNLQDNSLNLFGEPSYYFWKSDRMTRL